MVSDDWQSFEEFAASIEDPEEVVDAAASVVAVDKEESVLVEQMYGPSLVPCCVAVDAPVLSRSPAVRLVSCFAKNAEYVQRICQYCNTPTILFFASQHTLTQLRLQQYTTTAYVSSKFALPPLHANLPIL